VIGTLPFAERVDITDATFTFSEPVHSCYGAPNRTVWYRLTATANQMIRVTGASTTIPDVLVTVYRDTGSGVSGLQFAGCGSGPAPEVDVAVQEGATYYVQVGNAFSAGGLVDVSVAVVPPPINDGVGTATNVDVFPLTESVDMTGATSEAGEPTPSCFYTAATPSGTPSLQRSTPT
jgi:hypothetical protein